MNLSEIRLEALTDTLRIGKISDQEYFSKKYSAYVSNSRLGNINPEIFITDYEIINTMQYYF